MTAVARHWTLGGLNAATTDQLLVAHGEQVAELRAAAASAAPDRERMRLVTRVCKLRGELRRRGALRAYPDAPEESR